MKRLLHHNGLHVHEFAGAVNALLTAVTGVNLRAISRFVCLICFNAPPR
jgi:hypothetical protein